MTELLLVIYYMAVLSGMLLCGVHVLRVFMRNSPINESLFWVLSLGFCPVVISWLGFAGVFRLAGMAELAGIFFACYTLAKYRQIPHILKKAYQCDRYSFWFIAALLVFLSVPKWCYTQGGINNSDEVRSLTLTIGFAANYLKPAFPFNLSIPISYSYYLFQISAFLYSSVSGFNWPTIPIALIGLTAILFFYIQFTLFLRAAFPKRGNYTVLMGHLCITFFGLDIFIYDDPMSVWHVEFWNWIQVSTMATYHQWVYHYLLALGFGISALHCSSEYAKNPHPHWLYTACACALLSLTFGAITGAWIGMVIGGFALIALCYEPKKLFKTLLHAPMIVCISLFVILPQIFTFIGRDAMLVWWEKPLLWFSRTDMASAPLKSWLATLHDFYFEIGPLLTAGLFTMPFFGWHALKEKQWHLISIFAMAIITCYLMSMSGAYMADWFWRGGNLLLLVYCSVGFVWLYEWLRVRIRPVIMYSALVLGLTPGIINYSAETFMRLRACGPALRALQKVNAMTDLHDVFYDDKLLPHGYILHSGRMYFDPVANEYITGYRNFITVRTHWFHFPENQTPCQTTWFGSALPSGKTVLMEKPRVFVKTSCETAKQSEVPQ